MNLKGITGIAGASIGNVERKPALHAANIITMAIARNAFLALLRLNVIGMASIMNLKSARTWQGNRNLWLENLKRLWYNLGGTNFDSLVKAYQAGSTKRALGANLIGKLPKQWIPRYITALKDAAQFYKSRHNINIAPKGIGEAASATTTATLVASLPVILEILKVLVSDQKPASQSEQDLILDGFGTSSDEVYGRGQDSTTTTTATTSPFSTENLVRYGIPAAAILTAVYFATQKRK